MGLDSVELLLVYENEFEICIPEKDAEGMLTPRISGDTIERILKESGRHIPRNEIDDRIKKITIETLSLSERLYHLDASYVEDFGLA